jgi:hypothetical protein
VFRQDDHFAFGYKVGVADFVMRVVRRQIDIARQQQLQGAFTGGAGNLDT